MPVGPEADRRGAEQVVARARDEGRFLPQNENDGEERVEPDFATAVDRLPESSALRRCLEALDTKQRNAVVYAYVFGLSPGELAGTMSVPLGTAKSWTRRGLMSLQECMG